MPILSLIARLGLDGRQFRAGLKEAESATARFGTQLKGQLAAAFSAGAVLSFLHSIERTASRIKDLSEQFDLSTDDVQRFDFALKKDGLTAEDLGQALIRLGQARKRAVEGDAEATSLFARYGINLSAVNDGTITNIELLQRMKAAMEAGNVSVKDRIDLFDLLGKKAERLIHAIRGQSGREGIFFDKRDLDSIDEAGERFSAFFTRFQGRFAREVLAPQTNPLLNLLPIGLRSLFDKPIVGGYEAPQMVKRPGLGATSPIGEDKKLLADIAQLQEKIEKSQLRSLSTTERKAQLEREIEMHLRNADIIGNADSEARRIQVAELSKAAELADALVSLNSVSGTRSLNLTPLERLGGRAGAGTFENNYETRRSNVYLQKIEENTRRLKDAGEVTSFPP